MEVLLAGGPGENVAGGPVVMRLAEVARLVEAEATSNPGDLGVEVARVCAADLMSDVLSSTATGALLITGLVHPQVVRTSEVAGVAAILLVRGKRALPDTERLAREAGIPLLHTRLTTHEACGRLYGAGFRDGRGPRGVAVSREPGGEP